MNTSETISLCKHCYRHIPAERFEKNGQMILGKTCPKHGYQEAILDINTNFYKSQQYERRKPSSYWLDIAGPGYSNPQNVTKVSNFVNAGTFVVLDNLKATVTTSGNRGLAIASVSGTFNCYIGGYGAYNTGTGVAATTSGGSPYAVTTSTGNTSLFAWSFPNASDSITYHINDLTNNRFYRIQMMIGMSYNNNFISIERLI